MTSVWERARTVAAWVWAVLILTAAVAVSVANARAGLLGSEFTTYAWVTATYALLGLLIAVKQPGNRIAWLLLLIATGSVFNGASTFAQTDARPDPGTIWDALAIIWGNSGYFVFLLIPLILLLYTFPTGHFMSRRWAIAGWVAGIAVAVVVFVEMFAADVGPNGETWTVPNPLGFHHLAGLDDGAVAAYVFGICFIALFVGAPVALVFRYRGSSTIVRTQIKYVVFALSLVPLIFVSGTVLPEDSWISGMVFSVVIAALPVAIGLAILRYNLFDIDVVISRSLAYAVLAVFIGGVYVGIVVGVGGLVGGGDGSSVWLSVAATAVVALVFQPVRVRVQRWANRVVYGKRASPYEVLARFSHRAAEESDGDVLGRIPRLIVDGTGAAEATLWVAVSGGFRAVSRWPETGSTRRLPDDGGVFVDPEADVSLPVFHDGELLGGVSLVAARGGVITPPELELVSNLAGGLGLTLRNSRLTAVLRRQVEDLERSRDRVVSAADEARRSLERDLDSGPQQQLVAVKVQLGALRRLAEQTGASRTAAVLADIDVQAGEAIAAVRDFAAGVYPPLLGAEGLAVALTAETRKAAVPVDVEVDGVGRYRREVESAVYFSVLEALQNTAKYANATRAVVSLVDDGEVLTVTVSDDGDGFDPATTRRGAGLNGITDRIDTIGGTTTITATPRNGTTITGSVPVGPTNSPAMGAASDDMSFATSGGGGWGQRSVGPK